MKLTRAEVDIAGIRDAAPRAEQAELLTIVGATKGDIVVTQQSAAAARP